MNADPDDNTSDGRITARLAEIARSGRGFFPDPTPEERARYGFTIEPVDPDELARWARMFATYTPHETAVASGEPLAALQLVARLAREAPDEDHICALAVAIGEWMIERHWESILPEMLALIELDRPMQKMVRCCYLSVPDNVENLLMAAAGIEAAHHRLR